MAQQLVHLERITACAKEIAAIVAGINTEQVALEIIRAIGHENVDFNNGVKPDLDEKVLRIGAP